ncbi:type II toxin-antitoxin system RelB family antitoxin [Candidatus Electrothrix sp.]|uniref:type II toxin-antitoxin system RelB family antitoxin n=1 Tax=Candidatus Electrothrix sp. TaxID=2170559 RepID=UPI0040565C49
MSTALSVRLPDELAKKLSNVAVATERSKSFLVQKALEGYLQNQADLQVSLDRLRDTSDPIVSIEEIREEIGL